MSEKSCQQCKKQFELTEKDREFLGMLKVPEPTFCPECRLIRRWTFRNERTLYKRKCDLCQQESIMMYPSDSPFTVYCKPCWWSDKWDPKKYARDYDFEKPFFEQMRELFLAVPRCGLRHQGNIINSEYTNSVTDMRNCYLVFATTKAEDSRYSGWINGSKQMQDCFAVIKSERCYECIDCTSCYELFFSRESTNCRQSWFLQNCSNVSNSTGCVNLRNKQYCILNKEYTKAEYEKEIANLRLDSATGIVDFLKRFEELKRNFVVPALVNRRSIDSTGNWLEDCKDVSNSFNCQGLEHVRHCCSVFNAKDCMDFSQWGAVAERVYEANSCGMQISNIRFASECWIGIADCEYVISCHNSSKNLFGCVGLRNSQYCILNKQYTKEEYEKLVEKVREQSLRVPYYDAAGREYRYGEYFPIEFSPHAYNESLAQEFFPLSQDEAVALKLPWRTAPKRQYTITLPFEKIPETISEVTDDILKEIIGCAHAGPMGLPQGDSCKHQCTTAFRIIPEELALYRTHALPLPKLCPNCRHYGRLALRNPLRLWSRSCECQGARAEGTGYKNAIMHDHGTNPCERKFETSYAPERPEKVYCVECYQQEVA